MIDYKNLENYLENSKLELYLDDYVFHLFKLCLTYFKKNIRLSITADSDLYLDYIIKDNLSVTLKYNSLFNNSDEKCFKISIKKNGNLVLKNDLEQIAKNIKIFSKVNFKHYQIIIDLNKFDDNYCKSSIMIFCKVINYLSNLD